MAKVKPDDDTPAPMIYVMERGRVIIGRKLAQDGPFVILSDCACVRRWGTQHGLGELATKGPLPNTELDTQPAGTGLSLSHCQEFMPCEKKPWAAWRPSASK